MGWLGGLNFILMLVSVMPCWRLFRLDLVGPSASFNYGGQYAGRCPKGRPSTWPLRPFQRSSIGWPFSGGSGQSGAGDLIDNGGDSLFDFSALRQSGSRRGRRSFDAPVGGNFLLYWKSWERRSPKSFCTMPSPVFLMMFVGVSAVVSFHLWLRRL